MVELHPHQQIAVDELANGKVLHGEPGTGKSFTAVAYYIKNESPRDVYVVTTAKKRDSLDWQGDFAAFGVFEAGPDGWEAGIHGTLRVVSWNTLERLVGVSDAFFIFDEQRAVGSGKWAKSFIKIAQSNRWILLTATPGDVWMDYVPLFVANGFYKNRTQFTREHVVYNHHAKFPKIDRYVGTGKLAKLRNQILVAMPYAKHTNARTIFVDCPYDLEAFSTTLKKRWNVYEEKPIRDVGELFRLMRKVVNSDSSRFLKIRELLETHPKLIIFYNFDYELDVLRELGEDVEELAEWNGHKHEPVPEGDSWVYLVNYVGGAEAWNCVSTDAMVFYSLTYSYKNMHQAYGRIDRLNTPFNDLHYYVLRSKSAIDQAIWKALKQKKNFNEADFVSK